MTAFDAIPNAEIDIDAPVKSSTASKLRDNPESIMEGDATALAAGKGVFVEKSGQTALITDETDTKLVLRPGGAGSAAWGAALGWTLVERKEIAAAVTTVSFTGLDGNTDEVYKLIGRIVKPTIGISTYSFRPNGVVTNQSMGRVINGAAVAVAANLDFFVNTSDIESVSFECLIHARDTVQSIAIPRSFIGKVMSYSKVGNIFKNVEDFGGAWDTTANMTSLDINSSVALKIGIGSTFELFKAAQA